MTRTRTITEYDRAHSLDIFDRYGSYLTEAGIDWCTLNAFLVWDLAYKLFADSELTSRCDAFIAAGVDVPFDPVTEADIEFELPPSVDTWKVKHLVLRAMTEHDKAALRARLKKRLGL